MRSLMCTNFASKAPKVRNFRKSLSAKLALRLRRNMPYTVPAGSWPQPRHQRDELDQVVDAEPRSPAAEDDDRVDRHQARPACGKRGSMPLGRSVEDPIFPPLRSPSDELDLPAAVRMERVGDPNRLGHRLGAGCSAFDGRRFAEGVRPMGDRARGVGRRGCLPPRAESCSDDCVNPICMRLPTREGQRRTGTGTGIQQFRSFMPSDRFQPVRASSGRSIARTTRSARGVRQTMVEPTRPGGSLPGGRAARALAFGERKNRDASVAVASPPAALPVRARSTMVRRTSVPRPWSRPCQENGHSRS